MKENKKRRFHDGTEGKCLSFFNDKFLPKLLQKYYCVNSELINIEYESTANGTPCKLFSL